MMIIENKPCDSLQSESMGTTAEATIKNQGFEDLEGKLMGYHCVEY